MMKLSLLTFISISLWSWAVGPGQVKLTEDSANGSNYTALRAASSISNDVTYILPPADGSAGQLLSTNGSGTLSWAKPETPWTLVAKSSNYSILSTDRNTMFLVSGTTTMTLPSPSGVGAGYRVSFNNVGSNTVTVQRNAAETINGSNSFTMATGESAILITDGTNWSFHSRKQSSGTPCSPANVQAFNANGTWYKPSNCGITTTIQCWGGGGGGGGGKSNNRAGGGGGGAYNTATVATSALSASETVTIGAGGVGGSGGTGADGSAGGTSSVGTVLYAYGGGGGAGAAADSQNGGGGGGGTTGTGTSATTGTGGNGGSPSGGNGGAVGSYGMGAVSVLAGPNYAGTAADAGGGSAAWSNVNNALTSNNSRATVTTTSGTNSNYLRLTNFGFSVPADSVIAGVKVEIEKSVNNPNDTYDAEVYLVKGGAAVGNNYGIQANWPITASEAFITYLESGDDTWGTTLTASDVNASNFGVQIRTYTDGGSNRTWAIDSVRITIYTWTNGGAGGAGYTNSVWYGNRGGHAYFGGGGGGGANDGANVGMGGNSIWGGGGGGGSSTCCSGNPGGTSIAAGNGGRGGDCDWTADGEVPAGGGGGGAHCGGGDVDGGNGGAGRCVITTN